VTGDDGDDAPGGLLGPDIRAAVERILADAWGTRVELAGAAILAARTHVVRVTAGDGRSAVVKRPRDEPGGRWGAASHGFDVEWAGLEHLASMPEPVVPALLGGDRDRRVIVLEDLGVERTLADALLGADADQARADVVVLGGALGSVHGWSIGRADELARVRAAHGVAAPARAWWADVVRAERAPFRRALDRLGLGDLTGAALERELDALDGALTSGPWRGFVHGDPCPDNAVVAGGRVRLVDVERSSPGSVALDAAYLLAPFPSCWCFGRVPADLAAAALGAHRRAMADHGVVVDDSWAVALAYALGAFVVARGRDAADALTAGPGAPLAPWGTTTYRPRVAAWAEALVSAPAAAEALPRLCAVGVALRDRMRAAWPDQDIPHYPPFAPAGAPVALRPDGWSDG
jgi:hypothetical protein